MKKAIFFLAVFTILVTGAISASADSLARDAMMTYTGTEAFTKLTSMERQACVDWLVHGGEMSEQCCKAVKKLVAYDPDAVTSEQRQALIAEASGYSQTASTPESSPVRTENPTVIVQQEDNTGKYIAAGVLGVIAGMVIHNNIGGSSGSSCRREPPRYCPPRYAPRYYDRRPSRISCPPRVIHPQRVIRQQRVSHPQRVSCPPRVSRTPVRLIRPPRQVSRPVAKRPHCR